MKTEPEALISEIADEFHTYIGRGVRLDPIVGEIEPDLNIDDLEMLLGIHFVLTESTHHQPGVIDFVDQLPERIRRLKTTVTHNTAVRTGEVRGRIDWQQTVKHRYRTPNPNPLEFVCQETEENFDIPENIVLKRLLSIVHQTVFEDLEPALDSASQYEWLQGWIDVDSDLSGTLDRVFRDNVYVRQISTPADVSPRTIQAVKRSREPLYAEAAQLLNRYQRLMAYNFAPSEAKALLRNGFIIPDKTELLFELYWIFKVLSNYEEVRFHVLRGAGDVVAEWTTSNARYVLYHDSTGSTELKFSETIDDIDPPKSDGYLRRMVSVIDRWQALTDQIFEISRGDSLWGGRPDILIERYSLENGGIESIFVGEVKYTRNKGYAAQGLRELLKYMAFVRNQEKYFERPEDLFDGVRVRGALFVDEMELEAAGGKVSVYQFGDDFKMPF